MIQKHCVIESLIRIEKPTILHDFVRLHRPNPKKQATLRFETLLGKQAQMDWGYIGKIKVNGKEQDVCTFVMILGYSRMKYVEFTTSMDLETLMKCQLL